MQILVYSNMSTAENILSTHACMNLMRTIMSDQRLNVHLGQNPIQVNVDFRRFMLTALEAFWCTFREIVLEFVYE